MEGGLLWEPYKVFTNWANASSCTSFADTLLSISSLYMCDTA